MYVRVGGYLFLHPSSHAKVPSPSLLSTSSSWSLCLCSFRNVEAFLWFFAWLVLSYLSGLIWNEIFLSLSVTHVSWKVFAFPLCSSLSQTETVLRLALTAIWKFKTFVCTFMIHLVGSSKGVLSCICYSDRCYLQHPTSCLPHGVFSMNE